MEKFTVEKLMELSLLPAYHFPWEGERECTLMYIPKHSEMGKSKKKRILIFCMKTNEQEWVRSMGNCYYTLESIKPLREIFNYSF